MTLFMVAAACAFIDTRFWHAEFLWFTFVLMLAYQMRSTLTDNGLGEPMFLFEGISAWPTVAPRLLAVLISLSALAGAWRNLRINRTEIEATYHLRLHMRKYEMTLWGQVRRLIRRGKGWTLRRWCNELGHCLLKIFFPLLTASDEWSKSCTPAQAACTDGRKMIVIARFWGITGRHRPA